MTYDATEPRWRITNMLRDLRACLISMVIHLVGVTILAVWVVPEEVREEVRTLVASALEERPEDELVEFELEEEVEAAVAQSAVLFSSAPEVGAEGNVAATAAAPELDQKVVEEFVTAEVNVESPTLALPSSRRLIAAVPDGAYGDPRAIVDDYQQAMDRITQELLWMLDKGDVLAIWCFDQSESMEDDQKEIRDRVDRVYSELGLSGGNSGDHLMTAVTSFGKGFTVHTPRPTSDRQQIRQAIEEVPVDPSGLEMMCHAITRSILQFRDYVRKGRRQMALIVVTDESGDRETNHRHLEETLAIAKATGCRVYVLGREAVFGYPYAHIRWQHPQTNRIHWLPIDRGPETAFVEQLQTNGFRRRQDAFPSGFGPYEQARLCRETGGVFFMLPSLESNLVRGEKRRYELEAMRAYRPDLRARIEVLADRDKYPLRTFLWKVIHDLDPYNKQSAKVIEMRIHFSPEPNQFVRQARTEQQKAILYLRYLAEAEQVLEKARKLRRQEADPRWQANYDLIYAQLIAYQARIYEYGAALEDFLQDPKIVPLAKPPDLRLVHWDITTQKNIRTTESEPYIHRASELFLDVIDAHPGTPWAARAQWELDRGFGVELREHYRSPYREPSGPKIPVPKY